MRWNAIVAASAASAPTCLPDSKRPTSWFGECTRRLPAYHIKTAWPNDYDSLSSFGSHQKWAHEASRPDGSRFIYYSAGGFAPAFETLARQDSRIRLVTLNEMYGCRGARRGCGSRASQRQARCVGARPTPGDSEDCFVPRCCRSTIPPSDSAPATK